MKEKKEIPGVICPVCALWRPIEKTGSTARQKERFHKEKGRIRLDHGNLNHFIDIRVCQGKNGFPRIRTISLEKAKGMREYEDLVSQLRDRCREVLEVLEK